MVDKRWMRRGHRKRAMRSGRDAPWICSVRPWRAMLVTETRRGLAAFAQGRIQRRAEDLQRSLLMGLTRERFKYSVLKCLFQKGI